MFFRDLLEKKKKLGKVPYNLNLKEGKEREETYEKSCEKTTVRRET